MKDIDHSWVFKKRGMIGIIFLFPIGVAISFSYPMIKEDSFLDLLLDLLGWGLFLTYITFRLWATLYIGGRKDKQLQTEGPYSMTRNPLYFGSFCFALSLPCFLDSAALFFMILIASILYLCFVIRDEELYLESQFGGEFKKYCQRTPCFLPSPFRYYQSEDSINVNLKAVKREAKRLCGGALFPIFAEIIMHLRETSWWPHWFMLP